MRSVFDFSLEQQGLSPVQEPKDASKSVSTTWKRPLFESNNKDDDEHLELSQT